MSNQIDVLYFPGDDRAEDASAVTRDLANSALARANELEGTDYSFNWIDENDDARLTVGLRVLDRMKGIGIDLLDAPLNLCRPCLGRGDIDRSIETDEELMRELGAFVLTKRHCLVHQ